MEILNKNNMVERIFYILFIMFILIMSVSAILKEMGYIQTPSDICKKNCSENNMTSKFMGDTCNCCIPAVYSNKKETLIEEKCYEVISLND